MYTDKNSNSNNGISFLGLLFLVLLTLKLTGNITWSWFWVTAPLWGSIVGFLFIISILLLIALIKGKL